MYRLIFEIFKKVKKAIIEFNEQHPASVVPTEEKALILKQIPIKINPLLTLKVTITPLNRFTKVIHKLLIDDVAHIGDLGSNEDQNFDLKAYSQYVLSQNVLFSQSSKEDILTFLKNSPPDPRATLVEISTNTILRNLIKGDLPIDDDHIIAVLKSNDELLLRLKEQLQKAIEGTSKCTTTINFDQFAHLAAPRKNPATAFLAATNQKTTPCYRNTPLTPTL